MYTFCLLLFSAISFLQFATIFIVWPLVVYLTNARGACREFSSIFPRGNSTWLSTANGTNWLWRVLSLTHLSLYSLCSTWRNTFSWMNSNRLVYLSICNVNSVVLCYSSYTCPLEHIGTYWLKSYIHPHPVKSIIHRTLWWWIHEEAKKLQPNYWLKHLEFFIQQILFMWNNYNTNLSFDKQKCCWK